MYCFTSRHVDVPLLAGGLLLFVYFSFLPIVASAANEVTLDEDATLILPSDSTQYTLLGGSKFDSLTINDTSFEFVLSGGGKATLESSARKLLKTSDINKSTVCTDSKSSIIVELDPGNSDGKTITVTPSSDTCASTGAGGSSSGGGGGSGGTGTTGGGSSAPTVPSQTPVVTAPLPVQTVPPPATVASPVFASDLTFGMQNPDVTRLQILLASDKSLYPEGLVSGYFGSLTQKAVQGFQIKYGIAGAGDAGFGRVGPLTRAKLAEVFGGTTTTPATPAAPTTPSTPSTPSGTQTPSSVSALFTGGLGVGSNNDDVKRLQQLLNSDPDTQVAVSGVGSAGNETMLFGSLTENAVKKFQQKYGIAKIGEAGYGYMGPKTRAKLAEVFGGTTAPAIPATPATPSTPSAPSTADVAALQAQIDAANAQLQLLMQQLQQASGN